MNPPQQVPPHHFISRQKHIHEQHKSTNVLENVLPPSSGSKSNLNMEPARNRKHADPEDECSTFIQNMSGLLPDYMMLHQRRQYFHSYGCENLKFNRNRPGSVWNTK
jgi:hypothetical protein